jgi:multisubunit Na+/H+ antiporter MnhG subunit
MSNPYIDAFIFILFMVSIGFSGIGVFGLFLFPDIRSRLYTAVRATLIGSGAMVLSVIAYAVFVFLSRGGGEYSSWVIHAIVLMCIVTGANVVMYRLILMRAKTRACKSSVQNTDAGTMK